jgi:hypothetical protein
MWPSTRGADPSLHSSWMGWFPAMFFGTVWIGDIYIGEALRLGDPRPGYDPTLRVSLSLYSLQSYPPFSYYLIGRSSDYMHISLGRRHSGWVTCNVLRRFIDVCNFNFASLFCQGSRSTPQRNGVSIAWSRSDPRDHSKRSKSQEVQHRTLILLAIIACILRIAFT